MFTNISWMNYTTVITIFITLFYLFVGLRYYPAELKEVLSGKRKIQFKKLGLKNHERPIDAVRTTAIPDEDQSITNPSNHAHHEMVFLIAALKENIASASKKQFIPQEFHYSLKIILNNYPKFKDSAFRLAINQLISSECKKYGTIALSEEDIVGLWDDVI